MKKRYSIILGLGLMLFYSCQKDLLYPESETQVSDQDGQPFSSAERISSQINGIYARARNGQFLGGRFQVYNEVKADNWINASGNQITAANTWSQNVNTTSDEVQNLWLWAYRTINDSNLFIDGMASTGTAIVGETIAGEYIGEAKFLRAISYYSLLQLYARPYVDGEGNKPGLPLRLTGSSSYTDFALARSTVAQVYEQILKDLNDAEAGLPATYSTDVLNTTRAHRNTAIALKTRVYLTMGKYSDVITEANKIVSSSAPFIAPGDGVANQLQANLVDVFRNYTTTESIFSMPFTDLEGPGTQSALAYYFYQNGSVAGQAEFYLNATGILGDANWKATDKRRTDLLYTNPKDSRTFSTKYNNPNPYPDYAPVIRYAEVLLNLAEARARVNGIDAQAIALLNAVHGRSDATTTFTTGGFSNGTALINTILKERDIEFLGEGLRNIDLMRTLRTIPGKQSVDAIPTTDARYIWPISGNELLYNNLMTNN